MPVATALTLGTELGFRATPALVAFAEALTLTATELDALVAREIEDNPALVVADEAPAGGRSDPALAAAYEPSWAEALLAELRLLVPARDAPVAEYVVGSLDERGFCDLDPAAAARALGVTPERVARVLRALREAGPPGIAARDARHCLLLQIEGSGHRLARAIVADHLEALARGALEAIAAATGATVAEVEAERDWIRRTLDPYPVLGGPGRAPALVPDIVIDAGGAVEVRGGASVTVDPLYRRLAPVDVAVRRDVDRATAFVVRLDERRATLRRVAAATARRQQAFLEHGARALRPLTRSDVAAELGLHDSTVSRAVAGKHVQLPSGRLMPFAGFFEAAAPVRDALARLVAAESTPLSDGELAAALRRHGHPVARRTVAKYRGQLGILPHALRG